MTQPSMNIKKRQLYVAIAAFMATAPVVGQSQDAIAECSKIASTGDRILCLEEALRSLDTDAAAAAGSASVSETAPAVEAGPEEQVLESTVATGETDIGAEQLEARERRNMSREEALATLESASNLKVADYRTIPYERLVVELENGQVWRQINGDVKKIRVNLSKNQTVDISESSLGGYQLRLNEMRRIIRVERIK